MITPDSSHKLGATSLARTRREMCAHGTDMQRKRRGLSPVTAMGKIPGRERHENRGARSRELRGGGVRNPAGSGHGPQGVGQHVLRNRCVQDSTAGGREGSGSPSAGVPAFFWPPPPLQLNHLLDLARIHWMSRTKTTRPRRTLVAGARGGARYTWGAVLHAPARRPPPCPPSLRMSRAKTSRPIPPLAAWRARPLRALPTAPRPHSSKASTHHGTFS